METETLSELITRDEARAIAREAAHDALRLAAYPPYGISEGVHLATRSELDRVRYEASGAMEAARAVQGLWFVRLGFWLGENWPGFLLLALMFAWCGLMFFAGWMARGAAL